MALMIKKKFIDPKTGETIEIEGTEAEVEAYERKQNKKAEGVQRQKRLLNEEVRKVAEDTAREVAKEEVKKFADRDPLKEFREFLDKIPRQPVIPYVPPLIPVPTYPTPYIYLAPCPFCHQYNCHQTHVWLTTTTDHVVMGQGATNGDATYYVGDPLGTAGAGSVSGNNLKGMLFTSNAVDAGTSQRFLKS